MISAPDQQSCIHDGTGILEPVTAVSRCADWAHVEAPPPAATSELTAE
jgi:hypothetical protein